MELTEKNYITNRYLWDIEEFRQVHERELSVFFQNYILQNMKYSKDDLLKLVVYSIFFIPTSESYKKWGNFVTVIRTPDEYHEEMSDFNERQTDLYGNIRVFAMTHKDQERKEIIEFNVKDVFEIEYLQ